MSSDYIPKAPKKGDRRNPSKLVLALRRIATSKEATDRVRLRACELLMLIDPAVSYNEGANAGKVSVNTEFDDSKLEELLKK